MSYKLLFSFGTWDKIVAEAKLKAIELNDVVEFEFNGSNVFVNKNTNLEWLWRDHLNNGYMKWDKIGPVCLAEYPQEVKDEIARKKAEQEERQSLYEIEYRRKEKDQKDLFEKKVEGVTMEYKDKASWDEFVSKNKDPYGKCCVDYAEAWAKLMQVEISSGNHLIDIADKTSHELGFFGITGFMYGAAVAMLSRCWIHGEELRRWHNKEYKHEGEGVVNPAVLTIK